jgi:hypothetical protein
MSFIAVIINLFRRKRYLSVSETILVSTMYEFLFNNINEQVRLSSSER